MGTQHPAAGSTGERRADPAAGSTGERLAGLTLRDRHRLRRRIEGLRTIADPAKHASAGARIEADIDAGLALVQRRRDGLPAIRYPEELPVSRRKDEILAVVRDHQVVIVAGETGSGKTTQLPKICLELGRGIHGMIGHTQPRRLAARSVAERIAEELGTPVGRAVGYTVRFADQVAETTLVKVMTDGILLAELQRDRRLHGYDTLIIDEAHERSLNIDFILGYLKRLLPHRPDLKVIITSATIDPRRFSAHFGGAPVLEVSGRVYPVEVRYRSRVEGDLPGGENSTAAPRRGENSTAAPRRGENSTAAPRRGENSAAAPRRRGEPVPDQTQAICEAVGELTGEGPGDILVFLAGEREIRDTADALSRTVPGGTEVLPLYARLPSADQHRIFASHPGRRVVLATNIAETSLTVPGIRYVVDPGTARISRYSNRTKVQRLPIEPISQASANQRAGRCGRLADGICLRLYTEADYEARPRFTDPEIQRTSLASVILQMTALGLGEVADFPFIDPPDRRQVADGVALLTELGALAPQTGGSSRRLTPLGRRLARLPVDPRLGRMVLEADRLGCLREVLVITAALSIQDPRERPPDAVEAATAMHARFADPSSDFLAHLNLWRYLHEQREARSSSGFRRLCRTEYLHYQRVREWQDLHGQLRRLAGDLGMRPNQEPVTADVIHQALLAGLLSHVGLKDPGSPDYLGARGARFALSPGSVLFRARPAWVMAAELVETTRLWAHVAARIEPAWVESIGGHLVRRDYSEPRWDRERASVVASERVTLYGIPLVASRRTGYAAVDPALCRELFIRHALVEGDWDTRHRFLNANREQVARVEELEHRARRRDILVDDQRLVDFYDARIGAEVVSGRHFDTWWKRVGRSQPHLLDYPPELLIDPDAAPVSAADFPDTWVQGKLRLPLSYRFEPGSDTDGLTVHIPLAVLNRVSGDGFDWQVPGLREDLVGALIRSLPKAVRREFVPASDVAAEVLERLRPDGRPLVEALGTELHRLSGTPVPRDGWDLAKVPDHLKMTFLVSDARGRPLGRGKDLAALRRDLLPSLRETLSRAAAGMERQGLRDWEVGALPQVFERVEGGQQVRGYPALVDEGDSVAVRVLETEAEQRRAMWAGTRRLILLGAGSPSRRAVARLDNETKLVLGHNPHGSVSALLADCTACAADSLIAEHGGPAWDGPGFAALRTAVLTGLDARLLDVLGRTRQVLAAAQDAERRLAATTSAALTTSVLDAREQFAGLVYPGFVAAGGWSRLPDLGRYLRALSHRLDRLPDRPGRDQELMATVHRVQQAYRAVLAGLSPERRDEDGVGEIRWMLEELRVSLFAQTLKAAYPVSEKRAMAAIAALRE